MKNYFWVLLVASTIVLGQCRDTHTESRSLMRREGIAEDEISRYHNLLSLFKAVKSKIGLSDQNPKTSRAIKYYLGLKKQELERIEDLRIIGTLTEIPEQLKFLKGLQKLYVTVGCISDLAFEFPDSLRELTIVQSGLRSVDIKGKGLWEIDLRDNPHLQQIKLSEMYILNRLIVDSEIGAYNKLDLMNILPFNLVEI